MTARSIFILLLSLLAASLWLGCGPGETRVESGNREQVLHVGNGSEPPTLDPAAVSDLVSYRIMETLWEPLVDYDPLTGQLFPAAAKEYEVADDGLTYTFYLREEARWSNGDPVTAQDFVYGIRRYLEPSMAAPYTEYFKGIRNAIAYSRGETEPETGEQKITWDEVGVLAQDDYTLRIEMNHPNPALLIFLRNPYFFPVHRSSIEQYGAIDETRNTRWFRPGDLVTNGPFRLAEWTPNTSVVVEKNPHYWDADIVRLNAIHFYPIENQETEYNAFMTGQLHKTSGVPLARLPRLKATKDPAFRQHPFLGTYFLEFNCEKPPLDDPQVRRALSYAIDREQIIEFVLRGGQDPAYSFIPPGANEYRPDYTFSEDVARARELLAEAGFPGGEGFPRLEFIFNTSEAHRAVAEAIQQMWRIRLGIEITLANQEWKVFLETRRMGNYEIARAGWVGGLDMAGYLDLFESQSGNNQSRFSNARFDHLVELGARELDPARRIRIFQQAERILLEEMPIAPIYHYTTNQMVHPAVRNWTDSVNDYRPIKYVYLDPTVRYRPRQN